LAVYLRHDGPAIFVTSTNMDQHRRIAGVLKGTAMPGVVAVGWWERTTREGEGRMFATRVQGVFMNRLFIAVLASSFLLFTGNIVSAQTGRARIASTPIRGEANLASAIIATVEEGGLVDVVDIQGDWYRVLVPSGQSKPLVGYVLARLIEIVSADGAPLFRPLAQGPAIPPVLTKLTPPRDKAAERERALKADVDTRRAELQALKGEPLEPEAGSGQSLNPAAADEPPALRRPNAPRTGATGDKKIWIDVNLGGAQSAQGAQAFTLATTVFREPAAFGSAYGQPSRGVDFDFGGGYMVTPMWGVGLSITNTGDKKAAGLAATIPHPTIFNAASTGAGVTLTELERAEGALNIQLAVVPRMARVLSDRTSLRLFAGPTYFRLSRQMVEDVQYTQQYAVLSSLNIISIVGSDARVVEGTGWGFHAGADVGYFFSRHAGVGGTLRFSRGSVEMAEPLSEKPAKMTTGGTQFGGGVRLRF
jgi:hypothetical protein